MEICPLGYYCPNSATARICPKGSYCPRGSFDHIPCSLSLSCGEEGLGYPNTKDYAGLLIMCMLVMMLLVSRVVGSIREKIRKIRRKQEAELMKLRKLKRVESEKEKENFANPLNDGTPSPHKLKNVAALPTSVRGGRKEKGKLARSASKLGLARAASKLAAKRVIKERSADADSEGTKYVGEEGRSERSGAHQPPPPAPTPGTAPLRCSAAATTART